MATRKYDAKDVKLKINGKELKGLAGPINVTIEPNPYWDVPHYAMDHAKSIDAWLACITYKPGFTFERRYRQDLDGFEVHVRAHTVDADHPDRATEIMSMMFVANETVARGFDEFVHRLADMVRNLEVHEFKEFFKVNGRRVEDPHPEMTREALSYRSLADLVAPSPRVIADLEASPPVFRPLVDPV